MTEAFVYKLLTAADWAAARAAGLTSCALDLADGYVHLSTRAQVTETARRHFAGGAPVQLLRFPVASLAPLTWEPSRDGALFPHLYGALALADADAAWSLAPGLDGTPVFPEAF